MEQSKKPVLDSIQRNVPDYQKVLQSSADKDHRQTGHTVSKTMALCQNRHNLRHTDTAAFTNQHMCSVTQQVWNGGWCVVGDQVYQPFKYQTASENNDKQLLFRRIEHNRAERHILSSSGATVKTMAGLLTPKDNTTIPPPHLHQPYGDRCSPDGGIIAISGGCDEYSCGRDVSYEISHPCHSAEHQDTLSQQFVPRQSWSHGQLRSAVTSQSTVACPQPSLSADVQLASLSGKLSVRTACQVDDLQSWQQKAGHNRPLDTHVEVQYKNELAENCTRKNYEIDKLQELLGATEHEAGKLKGQVKVKDDEIGMLKGKLLDKDGEVENWAKRFQELKSTHRQLRQKLDGIERYLVGLPTAEESLRYSQEIVRLKEELIQNQLHVEELQGKLNVTRKQLTASEIQVKDLQSHLSSEQHQLLTLEKELQRVTREDEVVVCLHRCEDELKRTCAEKEGVVRDLEKAKKLLETTHRRLRHSECRWQSEAKELKDRLCQEESSVDVLRQEVSDREQVLEKTKACVKELRTQNQDLVEQSLVLAEQLTQLEQSAGEDGLQLLKRVMEELGHCFSELRSLVTVCLQRARGEEPDVSVLLGVPDTRIGDDDDAEGGPQCLSREQRHLAMKQWLTRLQDIRRQVDGLRAGLCNQYAEDMGQNIQCATS